MIPLATREEARAFDAEAIGTLGIPGIVLMENAGMGATRVLLERARGSLARVLIIGGTGQNGGDAWVVARKLLAAGIVPRCMLVGSRARVHGDALINFEALLKLGLSIESIDAASGLFALQTAASEASLIVDGLFGTGLDREVSGLYAQVITVLNASRAQRFALDLPSGVDANTGQVLGVAIRATHTVTFAAHKRGLHQYPGTECAGEVHCVDIGVPAAESARCGVIEIADVARVLVPRAADAHKGSNGHVLAIAGSPGKTGAAFLASLGALRAGAGLVTIATHGKAQQALEQKVVEVMTVALADAPDTATSALRFAEGKTAAVLGPGFGLDAATSAIARELACALPLPCVLDADALTALAPASGGARANSPSPLSSLRAACGPRVLTPHPGEASRLLGRSTPAVQADRYAAALELAHASAQTVVLKGARTVIASPEGALRICSAGTPALGVAGTGDVLSGVIAALLCQLPPFEAAWVGVFLHALAGEHAAQADRGLFASEVAAAIPMAMQGCFRLTR